MKNFISRALSELGLARGQRPTGLGSILDFVGTHLSFLWDKNRYRFTESEASESFDNASLTLESDALILFFTMERGFLSLALQSQEEPDPRASFSIDLLWRLLEGDQPDSAQLDERYVAFLRSNLTEIEDRFRLPRYQETKAELEALQRQRAAEMFGPLPEGKSG